MFDVCFFYERSHNRVLEWGYILSHFKPRTIYIMNPTNESRIDDHTSRSAIWITSLSQLPTPNPCVLLAPQTGRHIQGNTSLIQFQHPEHCLYVFGPNHRHITNDVLRKKRIDHTVFIPTDSHHEMFAHTAAAITLFHRGLGHG